MSLSSGLYAVTSVADNRSIGRFIVEDLSLLPKQLFALPEGAAAPHVRLFTTVFVKKPFQTVSSLLFVRVAYPREERQGV